MIQKDIKNPSISKEMASLKDYLMLFKFGRSLIPSIILIVGYALAVNFSFTLNNFISFLLIYIPFVFFLYPPLYIMNDLLDLPLDRRHPEKKNRPIASGRISIKAAAILALIFFSIAIVSACIIDERLLYFFLLFFFLNVLYSAFLKHIAYVDLISQGFTPTLRFIMVTYLLAGKFFILYSLFIYLFAVFFGTFKRELEIMLKQTDARKTLKKYSVKKFNIIYFLCCAGFLLIVPFTQTFFRKVIFFSMSIMISILSGIKHFPCFRKFVDLCFSRF